MVIEEKKTVKGTLKRVLYFDLEKQMTKEEYENYKNNCDSMEISGADALEEMGRDASEEPDRFADELDALYSDWDDYSDWGEKLEKEKTKCVREKGE